VDGETQGETVTYLIKGYCAGILALEHTVTEEELPSKLAYIKQELARGEIKIQFANEVQTATEICLDIYKVLYQHQESISTAFKL
jgi:hypothetical protein